MRQFLFSQRNRIKSGSRIAQLTALLFFVLLVKASAQPIAQYTFSTANAAYTPLNAGNATQGPNGDEVLSSSLPIGFSFAFNGQTYSTFQVSTNGWVNLGNTAPTAAWQNDLANTVTGNGLCPLWDDHAINPPDGVIFYRTTGAAGSRVFTVEWQSVSWDYSNPNSATSFQLSIFETTNVIEFHYGVTTPINASASIGIKGVNGEFMSVTPGATPTVSTTVPNNNVAVAPPSGTIYRFTPPAGDFNPPVFVSGGITPQGNQCTPASRSINLTLSDATGIDSALVIYSVNDVLQTPLVLTLASGTATNGQYTGTIPAAASGAYVMYGLYLKDAAGNVSFSGKYTTAGGNLFLSDGQVYQDGGLSVTAEPDKTINTGTSTTVSAASSVSQTLRFTEIMFNRFGDGAPGAFPSYINGSVNKLVEISNLGALPVRLDNFKLRVYHNSQNAPLVNYTFPTGTVVPAGRTVLVHLASGVNQPDSLYFNASASNTDVIDYDQEVGFALHNGANQVIDAVAFNNFFFPNPAYASGVRSGDWKGALTSYAFAAGVVLTAADTNTPAGWQITDGVATNLTIGQMNAGVATLPAPVYTWSPAGSLAATNGSTVATNNLSAQTTFTVSLTANGCTATDVVVVSVQTAVAPAANFSATPLVVGVGQPVSFTDLSTNIPNVWAWTVSGPGTFTYTGGTTQGSQNPVGVFDTPGLYAVSLTASNAAGTDTETKADYIQVVLSYCDPLYGTGTDFDDYLDGVVLANINNTNSGGTGAPSYTLFPDTTSLMRSLDYTLTVTQGGFEGYIAAWIDYNQNGEFEANEKLGEILLSAGATDVIDFTVPATATLGQTRLRVREVYGNADISPCDLYTYGETEDYNVFIKPTSPCTTPPVAGNVTAPATSESLIPIALSVTGSTGNIQWQVSLDGGANWANIQGATSATATYTYSGSAVPATVLFRVRVSQGACTPAVSNEVSVTIDRYCSPVFETGTVSGDYINAVQLEQINNTNSGPAPAPFVTYYSAQTAQLMQTLPYTLSVQNGDQYAISVYAWLDFDRNGVFDAAEQIGFQDQVQQGAFVNFDFTVPAGASVGTSRLRVMGVYNGDSALTPCEPFVTFGEVEDYPVNLLQQQPCTNPPVAGVAVGPATVVADSAAVFTVSQFQGNIVWQATADTTLGWNNVGGATNPAQTLTFDVPGVYYVRVKVSQPGCPAVYTNVLVVNVVGPLGDDITNPIVIDFLPYTYGGNTGNYTNSSLPFADNQSSPDVFFAFTAPSCFDSISFSLCNSGFDTYIHILDVNGILLYSNDDNENGECSSLNRSYLTLYANDLTPGLTYYVMVEGYDVASGDFLLEIQAEGGINIGLPENIETCQTYVPLVVAIAPDGATFSWSNGSTQPEIIVSESGEYTVTVTNANGCSASQTVTVAITPLAVELGDDAALCVGASKTLDAGTVANATYLWNNGATTQTIDVTEPGTYSVTLTNAEGCEATDEVTITVVSDEAVTFTLPDSVFAGVSFTANATGADNVSWNFGAAGTQTGNSVTAAYPAAGTQTVNVAFTVNGCDFTRQLTLKVVETEAREDLSQFQSFGLYPNPNNGQFTLVAEWREAQSGTLKIYDLNGKVILSQSIENALALNRAFDLSAFAKGVYSLQLQTPKGLAVRKVVVR